MKSLVKTIFIDGTKIEANANKYTFVWKKAVTKSQAKLLIKLADFVAECEQLYDIKIVYGDVVKIKHIKRLRKKLYALGNAENITFVHGIGKRKTPLQKSIETLEKYLTKLKEYTQKLHICGKRNSYSKTDKDATFMRMKEDAEYHLKFKYKNITADAGYESEENYLFLEANNQIAFIKPANYEI